MQGHEGRFSVYVHASKEKPTHVSPYFVGRDIHSEKVSASSSNSNVKKKGKKILFLIHWAINVQLGWGKFSMVEAEKRLLGKALLDPDNQHFVLLSDRLQFFAIHIRNSGFFFLFYFFQSSYNCSSLNFVFYLLSVVYRFATSNTCIIIWFTRIPASSIGKKPRIFGTKTAKIKKLLFSYYSSNLCHGFVTLIFNQNVSPFVVLWTPALMEMAGIRITCYPRSKNRIFERVLR